MLEITKAAREILESLDFSMLRHLRLVIKFKAVKEIWGSKGDMNISVRLLNSLGSIIYDMKGGQVTVGDGDTLTIEGLRFGPTVELLGNEEMDGDWYEDVVWQRIRKILNEN